MNNMNLLRVSALASVLAISACNSDNDKPKVNYKPQAVNASVITQTEVPVTDMLSASDKENDPLAFVLVTEPKLGTVSVESNGNYVYTPNIEVTGEDSFEFSVSDGVNQPVIGTINITIEQLPVDFSTQVRSAFRQEPSSLPLSVNGRHYLNTEVETDFDELLVDF